MYEVIQQSDEGTDLRQRCEQMVDPLAAVLAEAAEAEAEWPEGVAGALAAGLDFIAAEEGSAHAIAAELPRAGEAELAHCRVAIARLATALAAGRERYPKSQGLPAATERLLLGGLLATVLERVLAGEAARLPGLAPELAAALLAPYVGPARAHRAAGRAGKRQRQRRLVRGNEVDQRPLPSGRHGIPAGRVVEDQRRRILAALTELLAESSYAEGSIAEIVARARVSGYTYSKHFENRGACLLAAYDDVESRLWQRAADAAAAEAGWAPQVAAVLDAVLAFFAAEPAAICLFDREPQMAEPQIATRRRELTLRLASLLRLGRASVPSAADLPEATEATLIDNVSTILFAYVLHGESARLPVLAPELTELLLTPYLGVSEAKRAATSSGEGESPLD